MNGVGVLINLNQSCLKCVLESWCIGILHVGDLSEEPLVEHSQPHVAYGCCLGLNVGAPVTPRPGGSFQVGVQ